ncbi:MAG TPA: hypothetical protein VGD40_08945 [Chryseosolibacter sp.]
MKPKVKMEGDQAVINGPLTIKHHKEVLSLLKKVADGNVSRLVIDHPSELDLSSVQMLWSLCSSKKSTNSPINVVFALNEADTSLLKRCGFSFLITSTL